MTPEFSRSERVDMIGEQPRSFEIAANVEERRRLAARFRLIAIDRLDARLTARRDASGVVVRGRVTAAVTQACSVTGDPIAVTIDEPVELRFVEGLAVGDEIELSDDALDTVEIADGAIDLGEAAAETMALALDPFPRSPGAAAALTAAGVIAEEDYRPLGALSGLKAKLEGR